MPRDFRELIARRRDGKRQTLEEFSYLAKSAAEGSIPDYQLAAWLMAAYLNPLDQEETGNLTLAMADSGQRLDLSSLPTPHLDKHSTGGVGDKTTLVLLPILAACGLTLVKMSGPGLGITGGTTDKLSSIPGFRLDLTPEEMIRQAKELGIVLTAQTLDLAPADKVLYALRDATATTASMSLIVSSILSKKIAGGAEVVVLDVKCGSGGFMKNLDEATALKHLLEQVGAHCGLTVIAEITDMSQPLGSSIGNALEVEEAIQVLNNEPLSAESKRFRHLCVELATNTLKSMGKEQAREQVESALNSGKAMTKAEQWFAAQGGPSGLLNIRNQLPKALVQIPVLARDSGYIGGLDAGIIGEIVVDLGGGRRQKGDRIDYSVGVVLHASVSTRVEKGERIATIHSNSNEQGKEMAQKLQDAVEITTQEVQPPELILA